MDPVSAARAVHDALNGVSARRAPGHVRASGRVRALPDPWIPATDLADALRRRRSGYALGGAITSAELATLLGSTLGVGRRLAAHGREDHPLSISPTAGGLRSLEAHVVVRDVDGVDPGVLRYDLESHSLVAVRTGDMTRALASVVTQQEFAERAAAVVALVGRLDVAFGRYPLRHYRTLHVDAGVAVQSLYLVGTALGLSCCAVAGYDDAACDGLLGLGDEALTLVLFAVGRPAR